MWIFQNNSFLSVVQHREQPNMLLVRSRIEGDIERAIPGAKVFQNKNADYRYRALVSKAALKVFLAAAVDGIDYPNFKDSIPKEDHRRHGAYMRVWSAMAEAFGAYVGRGRGLFKRAKTLDELGYTGPSDDPDVDEYLRG